MRRRNGAFLRFLGVPPFMFDDLLERARPHLLKYERVGGVGCPYFVDATDVLALALRRYQISGHRLIEALEVEFGRTNGVISRALADGVTVLHKAVDG